ncbi:hypothetical protein ASH02_19700 [Nocardioides sp. Soil796]|nr:hypothetical protein ASH02_19700 [Nocardioides sp. Soil796]
MPASTILVSEVFDGVPSVFPLHVRVRTMVEQLIFTGSWRAGERIPSSRMLAEQLGVSRMTVQTAIDELIAGGYLRSAPRSGVFVNTHATVADAPTESGGDVDWARWIRQPVTPGIPHLQRVPEWWTYPYPLITGQHDARFFPDRQWLSAVRKSLGDDHRHASLDDNLIDDMLLIDELRRSLLPSRGIFVERENVLITLGAQEALALLADTLVRRGDHVVVEDPGYVDARHVFAARGAELVPVPVDDQGLRVDDLTRETSLCYTTPSHQHPSNVTLSPDRRLDLIRRARDDDFLVIEDDYDSELCYRGRPTPAIASHDPHRVIYLGSMSKLLAPGIRVGFVVADPSLIRALAWRRRYVHRQVPGVTQRALALFMRDGSFTRSLHAYRRELAVRWEVATGTLHTRFPDQVFPPGGTALWLRLPDGATSDHVVTAARERGILIDPGELYFADAATGSGFVRVGFSCIDTERVRPGLLALLEVIEECRG